MKNLKFGFIIILLLLAGKVGAQCSITLTSDISTIDQTLCSGDPIETITFSTTDATGATFPDLPTGLTGLWDADVVTITGTPTASGTFTVNLLGPGCGSTEATATITVSPNHTITLSSGNINPTLCQGINMTNLTFNTTGATGATVSGLPAGLSGSWSANVFTISGTPTEAGVFPYTVTTTGVCSTASDNGTITVNSPVIASISIATTSLFPICAGTPVTFTASPVNQGSTPTYQWKVNGNNFGPNSPNFTSSTLANNDVVTVVMTTSILCSTGSPATSNPITVQINPSVIPIVTIAANPVGGICAGSSVTFTASQVNGGTPSYQWSVNNTNAGTNSPTFSPANLSNNDVVRVIMTSTATCANPNTATSNAITMSVSTPGTASVSIAAIPSGPICPGTPVTFSATHVNGGSPTYSWRVNGAVVGTSPTYITSALSDNDIVTVMMTSSLTCVSGSPVISNQLVMDVIPPVTASVTITANPAGAVCAGTPVTFTAAPVNEGTAPVYQWRIDGVNAGTNNAVFASSTLDNNDIVTVVMTSSAQCATGNPDTSNPITMSITPSVAASVSIAAFPSGPVCSGTPVTFTATPVNGGTPSYQWRVNGANIGAASPSPTFTSSTLANNNAVTVVMTSSITCVTGNPATSNALTMTVNSLPAPTLNSSDPDRRICTGTSVTFTAGGGDNYNFLIDNISQQNSSLNTFTRTTLQNGDRVSVEVRNSAGCSTLSSELEMIVNTPPFILMSSSPTCSIDLSTYSFSVTVGPGIVTSTSGTLTNTSGNIWQVSGVLAGVNVTVRVTSAGCENLIVVTAPNCSCPVVLPPVSGGDKTYCAGGIIPPVNATVASGETIDWYEDSSGGTSVATGLAYTPSSPGTYYAQTRNITTLCVSSTRTPVTVSANQLPAATITSSDADNTFCLGTSVTFTAGGGTSYNFLVAGVSVQSGDLSTFTTSALINGQVVSVTVTSSLGCTATSAGITNTIQAAPVATLISSDPDNSICAGTNTTFTATGGTSYNFRVAGLSVQNGAAAAYSTTSLTNGQVVDVIVTNAAGCSATSSGITNAVFLPPTAGAGTGGNNCGLNFHFNATLSTGTGTWTRVSGPGNATFTPNANSPAATVNVSSYGNYTFRWTVVNGSCTSSSDITIVFIQQSAANAGQGGDECDMNYTFNALPITSGIGTWTKISGPGNTVFTPDINQPGATVTVDQFGTYDFAWSVVNSTCSSSDIIRVGFHGHPELNAGRDTAMCSGGSIQLQSTGSGTVLWTPADHVSNPTIINPVVRPDVTTTFTLSLTDQFGCRNSDEIIVGVRNNTTANAGPDQNSVYAFSTTLDAETPAEFETGVWSVFSGTGIFTDPTDAKTAVENLSPGENRFIWTVSNGFCPLSRDTSNIYVNDFVIPTLITPNMDGRNDYFVISGLFTFGKTELVIFDRRGSKVYNNPDYDNTWDGVNYNNNPLPDDTYFYSLKTANGISFKGYIVIKR